MISSTKKIGLTSMLAAMAMASTGCIDSSYDLSDIDSNVTIKIDDLVIPFEMEKEVTLGSLIDAEPLGGDAESDLRYDSKGNYLVVTTGTFEAEEVNIRGIDINAPEPSQHAVTTVVSAQPCRLTEILSASQLHELRREFDYSFDNVSDYIQQIETAYVDLTLDLRLAASVTGTTFSDMQFTFPKGLYGTPYETQGRANCTYDPSTGILTASGTYSELSVSFPVASIDIAAANGRYEYPDFVFQNAIALNDGTIQGPATTTTDLTVSYDLSFLSVNAITGHISYNATVDPSSISLTDIPSELRQPGTNLTLLDPQLYFNINNPLAAYGAYASTGIELYQLRPESTPLVATIDRFDIGGTATQQVHEQTVCIAPSEQIAIDYAYEHFDRFVPCTGLGKILSGNGLPEAIEVHFTNPGIPYNTPVHNFPVGITVQEQITGHYSFYAPLALGQGSQISYNDDDNSISFDSDVVIKDISISAQVISDIPLQVKLRALPLDKNGDVIESDDLTIDDVTLEANSQDNVTLGLHGNISGLKGIRYSATITATDNTLPLNKNMALKLNNIRAKINGYYQTEL